MKNMKIEINKDQPLDDVVKELEKKGYEAWKIGDHKTEMIVAWEDGTYSNFDEYETTPEYGYEFPTLAELKEMK